MGTGTEYMQLATFPENLGDFQEIANKTLESAHSWQNVLQKLNAHQLRKRCQFPRNLANSTKMV